MPERRESRGMHPATIVGPGFQFIDWVLTNSTPWSIRQGGSKYRPFANRSVTEIKQPDNPRGTRPP